MAGSFKLKGSLFTLSVLQLTHPDLDVLEQGLKEKIAQAPKFFSNAPVVIDLNFINFKKYSLDLLRLHQILKANQLVPVGVRGASTKLENEAVKAGFAIMSETETEPSEIKAVQTQTVMADKKAKATELALVSGPSNLRQSPKKSTSYRAKGGSRLITRPIRSGQQVYVEGGDLVVIAPVSPGAELLAEGNIHVYGTLRGRALAGVNGDENARIFCHKLEAELVSIAGNYKLFEDIEAHVQDKKFKQLYLKNGQLVIDSL